MEIVLAVLLFFGGLTLGSITADKGDNDSHSTVALPYANRAMPDPTRCHSNDVVIYRDLTVPYQSQIKRPAIEISDCAGECPDD